MSVTFRVPGSVGASSAEILGDFNDWAPIPMDAGADGGYEVSIDLEAGAAYRFRYLIDGERWDNDWAADDYLPNDYGSDDSIVDLRSIDLTAAEAAEATTADAPAAKPAAKPAAAKRRGPKPPAAKPAATKTAATDATAKSKRDAR